MRTGGAARRAAVKLQRRLRDNERLLVVAVSSMLMSASHTALRPVLPLFAKVGPHACSVLRRWLAHSCMCGCATPACMQAACKSYLLLPVMLRLNNRCPILLL